jgi:hypothetical protein
MPFTALLSIRLLSFFAGTKYIYIHIEYQSVCPLVGIGTLPPPSSFASECAPPPQKQRGGAHSPAGEGLG